MAIFLALAIAVVLHLGLIAWFTSIPAPPSIKKRETVINVTFEKRVAKKSPVNQVGNLENQTKSVVEPPPVKKEIEKEIKKPIIQPKAVAQVFAVPKAEKKIIETKVKTPKLPETKPKPEKIKKVEHVELPKQPQRPKISLDLSLPQTANLANNIDSNPQRANDVKVKNVDDFSGSQKDIAEQYRARFAEKITKKFTEMDSEKDVSGWVNFEVEIKIDGTISSLRITNPMANIKISKPLNAELKQFAEKVIRASAPFEPLPFELGVTALRISRNYNVITKKYDGSEE